MHIKYIVKIAVLFLLLTTSCNLRKELVYFNSNSGSDSTIVVENKEIKLKYDDIIALDVVSVDMEAVKVFYKTPSTQTVAQPTMYANGVAAIGGYLINKQGEIDVPLIGKIKISDLTRTQAEEKIKNELKNFLAEPTVSIRIMNFKVTVLGEVKNPGTFNIPNERITISEALGLAGDLTISGIRKNVLLIREEGGIRKQYRLNLTDENLLYSDLYYLQQNDVIYVEPNRAKRNSSLVSSTAGVFISVASLIVTTITLITR